jgi:PKD repeat protein
MKKLVFTLLVTFLFFGLNAQVDRETVLLEIGTGGWCVFCPGAAMGADDLHANGDPVAIIEYHNGDPFATTESNARNQQYYGIGGYPTAWFDGKYNTYEGGNANNSLYSAYLPIVNARMGIQTDFTLEIYGSNTGDNYNIVVKVNKVGSYSGTNLKVRFAVTESDIQYAWQNQTEMNFVCRDMVPDQNGTAIDFSSGDEQEVELSFTFNNTWNAEECELIAFLQDDDNKVVQHSAHVMLNDLEDPEPTFVAGFYAEETGYCETPAVAYFHSDCIGTPTSYSWTFEGGLPATSLVQNPVITYLEEGSYDVRLIVSNGSEWDTLLMEKYINVDGLPVVSWEEVPEQCNESWGPYMLTEGQPEGGVYSGEHVMDGYFNPQGLEAGSYPVTYTYMNEAGCEASEDYNIEVVNCVGIGEKEAVSMEVYPNPTSGLIHLTLSAEQFNNADISVIDAVGKEVYRKSGLNVNGSLTTDIDLSSQPQGIYFVTVKGDSQRISQKIFVRH